MVKPVYSLFPNFKVGKTENELVIIAGLTKLNPKVSKEVNTRFRLSEGPDSVTDIFGRGRTFEVEGEVLAPGEDAGNALMVEMEDSVAEDAKLYFEFSNGTNKYTGKITCDITTNGGAANDIITFSGTLYVDGKVTKTAISE